MDTDVMTSFGLADDEARTVGNHFGVALEQVRRDHLISHILAALSASHPEELVFFGGTALARTHLPSGRLSEDIDLIATGRRQHTATAIQETLERELRRSHGRVSWAPSLVAVRDTDAAVLLANDGELRVRVQLLRHLGYPAWPTEMHAIEQRYSDVGSATLRVPTAAASAAWKTVAWHDRHTARDLWDLWALSQRGHITDEAAKLFMRHGPTAKVPQQWMFSSAPSEAQWLADLGAQTRVTVEATEALRAVADAWAKATNDIVS